MKASSPALALFIAAVTTQFSEVLTEPGPPRIEAMDASELVELYFAVRERLSELGVKPKARMAPPDRIVITRDYRIFIRERSGKELILSPLVKTVFIFFLRHPEGVAFKELPSFQGEMLRIYSRITGRTNTVTIRRSIARLTDISDNSIHEKCSRLKESLSTYFNEKTLDNYVVKGRYGRGRGISLDRNYVVWEEST